MLTVLIVFHIIVAILLTLIILLQEGESGGLGGMLGGGGDSMFSATGGQSFLTRTTAILAVIFVITSLSIAKITSTKKSRSVLKEDVPTEEVRTTPDKDLPAETPTPESGE